MFAQTTNQSSQVGALQIEWKLREVVIYIEEETKLPPVVQRVNSVIHWISCSYPVHEICRKTRHNQINIMQSKGKSI